MASRTNYHFLAQNCPDTEILTFIAIEHVHYDGVALKHNSQHTVQTLDSNLSIDTDERKDH
jgi:hypothetical protein